MTRFLFPDDRMAYLINQSGGGGLFSASGQVIKVYLDSAGHTLATDLLTFPGQSPISSGQIVVDHNSQLPQFYGPNGVEVLYIQSASGGDIDPISADLTARVNALESSSLTVIEPNTFTFQGNLVVKSGVSRWYIEQACTWDSGRLAVGTAPTGSSIIVDVKKNIFDGGSSIYTTSANRPTIAINGHSQLSITPNIVSFAPNDYLTVDIVQVGSTIPGADLTYTIRLMHS